MLKEMYRMAVFTHVVEHGSFSKAAVALGLGKSVVSAHVAALESRLGTQLLTRSTRALTLTQEGRRSTRAAAAWWRPARARSPRSNRNA